MASLNATIRKSNKKMDGTYNVVIRVWHNGKAAYIDTPHFVTQDQLGKKSKASTSLIIRDPYVLDRVAPTLKKYRDVISDRADMIESMTALQLRDLLVKSEQTTDQDIDFISFADRHIAKLLYAGRKGSADNLKCARNAVVDFVGPTMSVKKFTSRFLREFEAFLRAPRQLERINQGKIKVYHKAALGDSGVHIRMRDLRILFNECRRYFNDDEFGIIVIPQNPYAVYKIVAAPKTKHRDLTIEQMVAIRDCTVPVASRVELARDLFMLSFYLCGMNAADMYRLPVASGVARIEYNRKKTESRRKDKAFISIAVPGVARPIVDKYAGQLQKRFANVSSLNRALQYGVKKLEELTGIPKIDFYSARHTFGSLARNEAGNQTSDIAMAMNHKDNSNEVTDIYIRADWSIIDRVQASTIALLERDPQDQ